MKYLILVTSLILFSQSFSHDKDEDHSKVTYETIRESISDDDFVEIKKQARLELARAESLVAQLEFLPFPKGWTRESDWGELVWAQIGTYWALKALDNAFKKGVCIGYALSRVRKHSSTISVFKHPYLVNDITNFQNLKTYIPYHYAAKYMGEKLSVYRFPDDRDFEMAMLEKVKQEISKLSKEDQIKTWELVSEWEEKWGDKIYNGKDWNECRKFRLNNKEYKKAFRQKIIDIYLKGSH